MDEEIEELPSLLPPCISHKPIQFPFGGGRGVVVRMIEIGWHLL